MSQELFSNVKVSLFKNATGNTKAHGSVLVAGAVEVRFTVVQGANGVFASLPSRKATKPNEEGKYPWYPDVRIVEDAHYKKFQTIVRTEYSKLLTADNTNAGEHNQSNQYEDNLPF